MAKLYDTPSEFEIEDGMLTEYFGNGGAVVIPDGVTDIFFQVFSYNSTVTSISIPGSVSAVTAFEFEGCDALSEAVLSEGVESVDLGAFRGCVALSRVVIPATLRSISDMAFRGCSSLREICFCGSSEEWSRVQKGEDWDRDTGEYSVIFDYGAEPLKN